MSESSKVQIDEAKRTSEYEQIKSEVGDRVGNEIKAKADRASDGEAEEEARIAKDLRRKAVNEVKQTDREVQRGRVAARISQFIDYGFFLIYGFLSIRLILELLAARQSAGFVKFVKSVTGIFYEPFRGIVPSPSVEGGFTLALPIVVAIVCYVLLHLAINGLLSLFVQRKTAI